MERPVLVLLLIVPGVAQIALGQTDSSKDEIKAAATEFADLLVKEDFTAAVRRFDNKLKAVMNADTLRDRWRSMINAVGAFEKQLAVRWEGSPERRTVLVTCQFQKAVMDIKVRFNDHNEVLTFFLTSVSAPGADPTTRKDSGVPTSKGLPESHDVPAKTAGSKTNTQKALLDVLRVHEAWKITRGSEKVLIGLIDNGFDFYHPALKNKIIPGYYYCGGYHSEFFTNMAHGTLVASIMVARRKGDEGMTGLAPGCKALTASQGTIEHTLLKLRSAWIKEHPNATSADSHQARTDIMRNHRKEIEKFGKEWARYQISGAAKAIRYLTDRGARVINLSGYVTRSACPDPELWNEFEGAFAYAATNNVVIVLGAGNSGRQTEDYPGRADTVIVAGASNLDDTPWTTEIRAMGTTFKQGSDFGNRLTVMAPTQNIRVCVPHAERFYSCDDGPVGEEKEEFKGMYDTLPNGATSSAAPIVSSLAALVLSARPDLSAKDVVQVIKAGCDDIGEKGYDIYTGHGRVNFAKTLSLAVHWKKEKG